MPHRTYSEIISAAEPIGKKAVAFFTKLGNDDLLRSAEQLKKSLGQHPILKPVAYPKNEALVRSMKFDEKGNARYYATLLADKNGNHFLLCNDFHDHQIEILKEIKKELSLG